MPWKVAKSKDCPASKPFAVIKTTDGSKVACHATEAAAKAQVRALYARTDYDLGGEMSDELLLKVETEGRGKIRNIVKSAHKWGGNGRVPKFNKIKRVLMTRHPEVIATAFGGNANVAAAWIKDQWYKVHGISKKGKTGSGPTFWRGKGKGDKMSVEDAEREAALMLDWLQPVPEDLIEEVELYSESVEAASKDPEGLVWKMVFRTGSWRHPNRPGEKLNVDLAYLHELVENFEEGAWEHVTVPLTHDDKVDENTGFVKKLEVRPYMDGHALWAGIEFTEPEIEQKALRGTIPNCSVGIGPVTTTEGDGKRYERVLKHVALTPAPWINKMIPFGEKVAASQDEEEPAFEFSSYEIDLEIDDEALNELITLQRRAAWDDTKSFEWARAKIDEHLRGLGVPPGMKTESDGFTPRYYCMGLAPKRALIGILGGGDYDSAFVADWEKVDDTVDLDPPDEWQPVEKTWVKASTEFTMTDPLTYSLHDETEGSGSENREEDDPGVVLEIVQPRGGDNMGDENKNEGGETTLKLTQEEFDEKVRAEAERIANEKVEASQKELREERERDRRTIHEMRVRERVAELTQAGHAPAVVKAAKAIYEADLGEEEILTLSVPAEDGSSNERKLSATAIVNELLASFPESALEKQNVSVTASETTPPSDDKDVKARADDAYGDMFPEYAASAAGNGKSE